MRKPERPTLHSLDRGLEILQLLSERGYSVEELSRALRCPVSTTYRTLTTLRRRNLVDRDRRQARYMLGFGILRLTHNLFDRLPIREVALTRMQEIAELVGETVVLTVRNGNFGVAVETIETSEPVRVAPALGENFPLHCGAPMKAILAFLSADEIEAYLRRPLKAMTRRTITDPRRVRKHLIEIRERGYAESWEEVYPMAVGVAVPIFGVEGFAIASLGIAGPVQRFTPERVESTAQRLLPAGKDLSQKVLTGHLRNRSTRRKALTWT